MQRVAESFRFQMDVLAKSEGTGSSEVRRISGVASANCQDAVGETVLQKGMDPRPAVERGFRYLTVFDQSGQPFIHRVLCHQALMATAETRTC